MSIQTEKSRRHFLKGLSTMIGGVAAGSLLASNALSVAMKYSSNVDSTLTDGKLFNRHQLIQLRDICAIVIPATETLGAAEVDTHGFIDNQLFHCFSKDQQAEMVQVLVGIDKQAVKTSQKSFSELNHDEKFALLTALDTGQSPFSDERRKEFKELKKLICFGYYTSEVGATQELRYVAIPGGYKGSIPYVNTDASWGSKGLFY